MLLRNAHSKYPMRLAATGPHVQYVVYVVQHLAYLVHADEHSTAALCYPQPSTHLYVSICTLNAHPFE